MNVVTCRTCRSEPGASRSKRWHESCPDCAEDRFEEHRREHPDHDVHLTLTQRRDERPAGQTVLEGIQAALQRIYDDRMAPRPVCRCGSTIAVEGVFGRGFHCDRGHRLPGQDIPAGILRDIQGSDPIEDLSGKNSRFSGES
ncbi:hypothetical protein [Mycolicibacterium sphagni]|uniref:hypothetical protein n=1 Tax=Mycolicibacterium sphagni TaxID=1786 RepID=UPI0021F35979|nr:hypothetical protein [Mycolicibacterium sphagni]MCV7174885.1 hypothetical protein [Mycolicibacterium sphagni]